jgi:hypothetical protein
VRSVSRPKQRKGGRVTPKGTGPTRRPSAGGPRTSTSYGGTGSAPLAGPLSGSWEDDVDDELPDGAAGIVAVAGDAIASGHPAELLVLTSALADAANGTSEVGARGAGAGEDAISWASVVEELTGVVRPETTALLHALRPLAPATWRERIDVELDGRSTPGLPAWIASIADVEVAGVWVRPDDADEGDRDVFLVARWPGGRGMTLIANLVGGPEGVVEDVLLAPADLAAMPGAVTSDAGDPVELVPVEVADARAFLEAAVRRTATHMNRSMPDVLRSS